MPVRDVWFETSPCNARKGHEIVAVLFSEESVAAPLIAVQSTILFFVRVNQVLVRLWARVIGLAVCRGVVGSLTTDHGAPATGSVVRLMSDRESVSGVPKPLFGCSRPGMRP